MKAVFQSDRGRVRPHNEDYAGIFSENQVLLAVVADGMGGHLAGEVASQMAVERLEELWKEEKVAQSPEKIETWLKENINKVNQEIYAQSIKNVGYQGMGTTIVAAVCTPRFVTVAHVGDSRCYLLNENGFNLLTDDHSLVNELVKSGQISKEDAENHPRKNVLLRSLGTETKVEVDIKTIGLEEDDILLLCSDGLTNKVSEEEIKDLLKSERSLDEKCEELIRLANENGGDDNITVAIVHNTSIEKEGEHHDDRTTN